MSRDETKSLLEQMLGFRRRANNRTRILVTLTFAQSVDAKIAGVGGKQLILSCQQSMHMTHRLRSMHDGILVGAGTALNDNPQLNTRLLPKDDGRENIPIPIILDSNLRFRLDSKLLQNYKDGTGRQPIIFTSQEKVDDAEHLSRRVLLESRGVKLIPIPCNDGKLDLRSLLRQLELNGIRHLMVEGGASVISSFLHEKLVDNLIITMCPTIVGDGGISYKADGSELEFVQSQYLGRDVIMAWKSRRLMHEEEQESYCVSNHE